MDNKSRKPSIEVERRRPGGEPAGKRERAEAPRRERERSSGGTSGGGGGGFPSLSGSGKPSRPLSIGVIILLLICVLPIYLFLGGGSDDESEVADYQSAPTQYVAQQEIQPSATRRPTLPPAAPGSAAKWTVMIYQDADDKVLEQDIFVDLNEAERVGSNANLNIIAQLDRYQAAYTGDGNWTGSRRYFVRQDDDLDAIGSDLVEDLGEVNMASGETLVDFAAWAIENYPADKYVLILSDHGMGWPGGWSDATASRSRGNTPLEEALGDNIYLNELDQALGAIITQSGIDKFEMIGMDACLMGHVEVMSALAPYARYAVLSQEIEPSLGWAYTAFLNELTDHPEIDGGQLGALIVDSYIVDDQRIVDDEARASLVGRNPMGSLFGSALLPSAEQVASQMSRNITLSSLDLSVMPEVLSNLNNLADVMQSADQRHVAQARNYAQSFTNIFGKNVPASYIDLGNFAELVAKMSGKRNVAEAAAGLQAALKQAVIAEKHGHSVSGATGVSIYFPNSQLYKIPAAGAESYTQIADRFASESLWDDFLAYHYTGETFDVKQGGVVIPEQNAVRAPAAGGISVSEISASTSEVSIGETVRLSVDIEGANIGYVKLLVGYLDQSANSIYLADSDFLASPDTREAGGVYYPDWGEDAFNMVFKWEPIVYAINDGYDNYPALFTPVTYGSSSEEALYTVEGIYTFTSSGEKQNARLFFMNGELQHIYGFSGEETTGSPHQIIPETGDSFTLLEKWMDLDNQGKVTQTVYQEGQTLTFSDSMFTWEIVDAAAGQYVIGFIIEDLDGNSQVVFTPIIVR
ncbi:MAG: hypothetical protein JW908_06990 [Anaerolineales bacterium]|nr:hypothetical protein [Anaerolineales bacterium]